MLNSSIQVSQSQTFSLRHNMPKRKNYAVKNTALALGLSRGTGEQILLDTGTFPCQGEMPTLLGIMPHLTQEHKLYSIMTTYSSVQTLSQSQRISPGLPSVKPFSNSNLPIAWITCTSPSPLWCMTNDFSPNLLPSSYFIQIWHHFGMLSKD